MAESRGNLQATNRNADGSIDRGLMQINSIHADLVPTLAVLYEPEPNMQVAHRLWVARGWQPWSSYLNGSYKRFL